MEAQMKQWGLNGEEIKKGVEELMKKTTNMYDQIAALNGSQVWGIGHSIKEFNLLNPVSGLALTYGIKCFSFFNTPSFTLKFPAKL